MSRAPLNRAQRAAVRTLSGPLLVLAGAGTGKTRVITFRIAELIRHGIAPDRILAVTFTNKAAREMKERALALLGRGRRRSNKTPEISTFHSLCVRILRRHVHQLGYPKHFAIYDRGDQESVARSALRDVRVGDEKLRPGELLAHISSWKCRSLRPEPALEAAESDKQQLAALAYERYQTALQAAGALDFDDLLLCTEELFEQFPKVQRAEAARFDHLLIDEYQDTNPLQYRIAHALARRHRNLCVVGDDDQSIYGWRGAEVEHILGFARDWPDAKVVKLEQNYRSREPILRLANTLITHNSARHPKALHATRSGGTPPRFVRFDDETAEAQEVVGDVRRRLDASGRERVRACDIAILFRTNEQPRAFEVELRRLKIPYVLVGGLSFYDRKEIRDVLAYLRLVANPADEVSLLRVINTPARRIGPSTVRPLLGEAVRNGVPLWSVLSSANTRRDVSEGTAARISAFVRLIESFRRPRRGVSLVDWVTRLIQTVDYRSELVRQYSNASEVEARWAAVEEFINALGQYQARTAKPSLRGFLDEMALAGREEVAEQDKDEPRRDHAITLMTLHSAKGLEFGHVYLVGMEEGLLPHQRSLTNGTQQIAEERRLCYVGVTRAQETLTLTLAKARMKWGKLRPSIPSRFIMEMRGETDQAKRVAEAAAARFGPDPGKDTKGKASRTSGERKRKARKRRA